MSPNNDLWFFMTGRNLKYLKYAFFQTDLIERIWHGSDRIFPSPKKNHSQIKK
jgi:hypothetical protein